MLVSLIKGEVLRLSETLSLFLSVLASCSSPESSASASSNKTAVQRANDATATLQLFLETYFVEHLGEDDSELEEDDEVENKPTTMSEETDEALQTLVRSYLTSLSVPVRFGEKNIDADIFGNRLLCLDKLPPFQESAKEILDASSPEFWCQNSLLKLQSLLSCPSLATAAVKETVVHFLEKVGSSNFYITPIRMLFCIVQA